MPDKMKIEILEDGQIKIETDGFNKEVNHCSASEFLQLIEKLTGGNNTTERKKEKYGKIFKSHLQRNKAY